MAYRTVIRATLLVIGLVGMAMLTCVPIAILRHESHDIVMANLFCALPPLLLGCLALLMRGTQMDLRIRDGYLVVVAAWLGACVAGALPYVWVGQQDWVDALFESVSGFTTTGSSILSDIEALPDSLLYWRAMTHWLGGMGIVLLALAILPVLGIGGMSLYKAESPSPMSDRLAPRIAEAAKQLWLVYLFLTIANTIMLDLSPKIDLFEAWCHACATVATGGFSTRNTSIASFDSPYIEWVTIVFMAMAGVNFALHLRVFLGRGHQQPWWKDEELRFYAGVVLAAIGTVTLVLEAKGFYLDSFWDRLRHGSFAVVSIITCTGFGTEDFDRWPSYCRFLLVLLMVMGGCVGSTSGGLKAMRVLVVLRSVTSEIRLNLLPRMVENIRLNNHRVDPTVRNRIMTYSIVYIAVIIVTGLVLTVVEPGLASSGADGLQHVETALSAAATTLGGVGPGLGAIGPACNFGWMADSSKLILILSMLLGRLELYSIFVLFMPTFWNR